MSPIDLSPDSQNYFSVNVSRIIDEKKGVLTEEGEGIKGRGQVVVRCLQEERA